MAFSCAAFLASSDPSWPGLSTILALGLMAVFFLRERIDDERVHSLKLKALKIAFGAGYLLSVWLELYLKRSPKSPFSEYDFVIVTMLIALGLFHFWRWQDARSVR